MSARDADTYESQNDQLLNALHSKIRSLRGVCAWFRIVTKCVALTLDAR